MITVSVIFMVLKLAKVISWSWWLVFLPAIIEIGFYLMLVLIAMIGGKK